MTPPRPTSAPLSLKLPPQRFRRRVLVYLLGLSLLTSTVSGAIFYRRQVIFLENDRARRSHTLLASLATLAELGAYAHDAALVDLPVRSTFAEDDVVVVGVYDLDGNELLTRVRPGTRATAPAAEVLAALRRDPDAPSVRLRRDGWDDSWAPIVTTARPAAAVLSDEPGGPLLRREVVGLARVGLSHVPARQRLDEVLRTGVWLAAFLMLLGGLAAVLIASRISGPIQALSRGADEIRAGNLDVRIHVASRDELGQLAESFNRMAARLRETMAELATLNRNLESEVLHRTDEIRRSAEFTSVLNAPLDRDDRSGLSDLKALLDASMSSLMMATGVRAAALLLTDEESVEFSLQMVTARGATASAFGDAPSEEQLRTGDALVDHVERDETAFGPGGPLSRARIPLVFRGEPLGALVLVDVEVATRAVEFARRACAQLAIAISNARAFAALQHLAHTLKERNHALIRQRDMLSEMNRLKSEFLANTSHELRTPLNAILGYSELITEGIYGPTTTAQVEALAGVLESGSNLLGLINQILDLSKVESGKVDLDIADVAVDEVAQAVATEAQPLAKERPYRVDVQTIPGVIVRTDRSKLKQIVTNLVSNAVKFTQAGSVVIEVEATRDGGARVDVRDTGIGIRREDQQLIFEEFRQVDGSSTRVYGGTGLGLAIARRFASLVGASLTVESELGTGSTFTLVLPREPRLGPPAPLARAASDVGGPATPPQSPPPPPRLAIGEPNVVRSRTRE